MNQWIQTEVVVGVSLIQKPHIISNTSNEPVEADEDRGDVARL